ncbi:MAG: KEOPS complex subunit Cgi121 [Aigarchaeota archaeon]|nr:KEOPS complex subunit Cgi121 [Aigarchaeota archaeon]MDW8092713.1 KEOPS complex subunit Cgi121 [Nitrososphaerota archaeon]
MEELILTSRYRGYQLCAFTLTDVKRDPLEGLNSYVPEVDEELQAFDPKCVVRDLQVIAAFMSAVNSFLAGTSRARRLGVEFLLKMSGSTQIADAIRKIGVTPSHRNVTIAILRRGEVPCRICERVAYQSFSGNVTRIDVLGDRTFVRDLYGLGGRRCKGDEVSDLVQRIALSGLA